MQIEDEYVFVNVGFLSKFMKKNEVLKLNNQKLDLFENYNKLYI
jgi:hypothetical protein